MVRFDLPDKLYDLIREMGGQTDIVGVCKRFWECYADELQASGDLLYTWQYDIRWAATELRKSGRMRPAELSPKGVWEII